MQHNGYSVTVPEGREQADGYVHMRHGQTYTLRLMNHSAQRCDAHVEVDGKHIGTWRLNAWGGTARLEHPVNDQGRFTFYRLDSVEGAQAGLQANDGLGLIKVTFTPERRYIPPPVQVPYAQPMRTYEPAITYTHTSTVQSRDYQPKSRMAAGGTGLSGHSGQNYGVAGHMELDHAEAVTIHLRLVEASDEPRPLQAASSTPVPPAVWPV